MERDQPTGQPSEGQTARHCASEACAWWVRSLEACLEFVGEKGPMRSHGRIMPVHVRPPKSTR